MAEYKMIPVNRIHPNPFQPRESFDEEKLGELKDSIRESGLIQPITVRQKGNDYEIIAGERRWRAHVAGGIKEIPAVVRDNISDLEMQELSLIENWHRVNLESLETENFLWKLWEIGHSSKRYGSYNDMSRKLGMSAAVLGKILKAHEDRKLPIIASMEVQPTSKSLSETSPLREMPTIRKQVLELHQEGKTGGMAAGARTLVNALRDNKDVAQELVDLVKEGKTPEEVKIVADATKDLSETPDLRKPLIALRSSEHIRKDELPQMAQVLKENPNLANYALDLKKRGESVPDIKRTIEHVKAKPTTERQQYIEAGVVFKEDPDSFKIEIPESKKSEISGQILELMKSQEEKALDPAFQEAKKLRQNLEAHLLLLLAAKDAKCPKCGKGKLVWDCCKIDLKESESLASGEFDTRS